MRWYLVTPESSIHINYLIPRGVRVDVTVRACIEEAREFIKDAREAMVSNDDAQFVDARLVGALIALAQAEEVLK